VGCVATYRKELLTIYSPAGVPIMEAPRSTGSDGLWRFDLQRLQLPAAEHHPVPPGFEEQPHAAFNSTMRTQTMDERTQFIHHTFSCPVLSTFREAVRRGYLRSISGFKTDRMLSRHPPHAFETPVGHMTSVNQHVQSTHAQDNADHEVTFPPLKVGIAEKFVQVSFHDLSGLIASDQAGALPSPWGKQYHVLMTASDPNYIHIEVAQSLSSAHLLAALKKGVEFFTSRGFTPILEKIDNAVTAEQERFFNAAGITVQAMPVGCYRQNPAERQMRTWKGHFISTLALADPKFPLVQSAHLVFQAEWSLNMLRSSRVAPHLSAWEQMHGAYDFNTTPAAPPGMLMAVHEVAPIRETWGPHAVQGFYIGPAFKHYRCYTCWIPATQKTRIADCIEWFPRCISMPSATPLEEVAAAATDLVSALNRIIALPASDASTFRQPLMVLHPKLVDNLRQLHEIFAHDRDPAAAPTYEPCPDAVQQIPATRLRSATSGGPTRNHVSFYEYFAKHAKPAQTYQPSTAMPLPPIVPPVDTFDVMPLPAPEPQPSSLSPSPAPVIPKPGAAVSDQRVSHSKQRVPRGKWRMPTGKQRVRPSEKPAPPLTSVCRKHRTPSRVSTKRRRSQQLSPSTSPDIVRPTRLPASTQAGRRAQLPRQYFMHSAYSAAARSLPPDLLLKPAFDFRKMLALATTVRASGRNMRYNSLLKDHDAAEWISANADEWRRLIHTTETLRFASASAKPADRKATYMSLVCTDKVKPSSTTSTKRVRAAADNGIDYPGDTAAETASLDTIKILSNAVISEAKSLFMTIDLKDFYLKSTLLRKEYAWVNLSQIAPEIIVEFNLLAIATKGKVLVEISKGIYGLPQSGKLAKDQLTKNLKQHGFTECEHTPCLFVHPTRDIKFTLVVDDFSVKYSDTKDVEFLLSILRPVYNLHIDWSGSKYLGITLDWDYTSVIRSVSLSLPEYVAKGLQALEFTPSTKPVRSPGGFVRPQYGITTQLTDIDTSPPVDDTARKRIQKALGIFNWYLRVTDPTFMVRWSQLGSEQTHATEQTVDSVDYVLNYLYNYPDAHLVFYASDMNLQGESDASYNSEPGATSRAGGTFFLGKRADNFVNGPIDETSVRIDAVCSSVT
jgi:hypothetical protein